jgi:integrase
VSVGCSGRCGGWQVRYRDLAGAVHTGPHTFTSKTDAARYLALVEADLHRGAWADPKLGRITLAEWADRWQQTTTNLRSTTRDLYGYLLRRFLLPTFGQATLSSIDVLAVRSWLAKLQAEGVSASTSAKAYRLLSRIFGAAVEAGYLLRNPCTVKGAGQERAPEMRFATVAQVAALADAIGPRYRALVLVAAYGGLRWGELVGLKVKRVDLLHGRVTVAEQVAEVNGRLLPGPPKTEAGRRTVTSLCRRWPPLPWPSTWRSSPSLARRGWCSRPRRVGICAAPTSAAAGGSRRPAPPAWRGCDSTTCATRPRPWR